MGEIKGEAALKKGAGVAAGEAEWEETAPALDMATDSEGYVTGEMAGRPRQGMNINKHTR